MQIPSELRLPQTVALAAGYDGFDHRPDRAAFEAALVSELPIARLPLERFLVDGGWPAEAVVRVSSIAYELATIRVGLNVTFDELVTACGGTPDARPRSAEFALAIDRATAVATIVY